MWALQQIGIAAHAPSHPDGRNSPQPFGLSNMYCPVLVLYRFCLIQIVLSAILFFFAKYLFYFYNTEKNKI